MATKKTALVPVNELIAVHQERTGYKNTELAALLGYPSGNIIAMLKAGTMRLPVNKIALAAEILHIDPLYLAMCVDVESKYNLTPLLVAVSKRTTVTLNEEKLIQKLRKISDDLDIDLEEYPPRARRDVGCLQQGCPGREARTPWRRDSYQVEEACGTRQQGPQACSRRVGRRRK